MRKILSTALLAIALAGTGCTKNGVAPPLAPGYANQADMQMGQILAGARAFYTKIQTDAATGAYVLSQTEKDSLSPTNPSVLSKSATVMSHFISS